MVLALLGASVAQMVGAFPDAHRGLIIYAREQKDLFVDPDLVQEAFRARAGSQLAQRLRAQTVIVGTRTSPHTAYIGSGVIVAERRGTLTILTARHVVAHHGRRFVIFPQGIGRYAQRVVPSLSEDLALVFARGIPGVSYHPVSVGTRNFNSGERFIVMGHPGAQNWTASPGVAEHHLHETLLLCPTCDRGDSGAGAFDRDGTLRGIVVSKATIVAPSAKTGNNFTLTAFEIEQPEAIRSFLRSAK